MPATYEPIASHTVGSGGVASVTFGSGGTLPQTYTDLVLIVTGTSEVANDGNYNVAATFNGDSGSNYSATAIIGNGSTASSARATSATSTPLAGLPGTTATTITPATNITHIMSYANTNVFKTILRTTNSASFVVRSVQLWRSTSAITSIELSGAGGDIAQGTVLALYGIKAA